MNTPVREQRSVEEWLQWFEDHKYTKCHDYLCTKYGLEGADGDALINTARLQVYLHWKTIQTPLAYFWQILRREAARYIGDRKKAQTRRDAYAVHWRFHIKPTERMYHSVRDILERVTPNQRDLLVWYVQGYDDREVAGQLGTTAHAVRQARHRTYTTLRKQYVH